MAGTLIKPERLRLLLDVDNWSASVNNLVPNPAAPVAVLIPNGSDIQFELFAFDSSVGAFGANNSQLDYTNIVSVVIALQDKNTPHNATSYWSVTIPPALINNTCTAANWTAGTDQQIKQIISSSLNTFAMNSASQQYWLCIYAITNGSTALYAGSTAFTAGTVIIDSNGNAQQIVGSAAAGTSGGSAPSWATTLGATTTDGGITWTRVTVPNGIMPMSTFQVALEDTGLPAGQVGVWPLPGPDGLLHNVASGQDAQGNFILTVDQTGYAGKVFACPFFSCSDGVYRTVKLVQSGSQIIATIQ